MKILFIVYDNDSHITFFPLGTAYLAAACRDAGHDVSIYHQDVYHFDEAHLTNYLRNNDYDVIGVGACGGYYQYRKIKKITCAVKESGTDAFVVLGGHLVSADPQYFLNAYYCHAISIGEGEETIVELLDTLRGGRGALQYVKGIAFLRNGKYIEDRKSVV
jgi:radical SAM superfamily enzyme YgiQ (UPF0313 family)